MTNSEVFAINSPGVVSETIDDEVVIVNLEKGHYYSLVKTGAAIWQGIENGLSRPQLIAEIAKKYDGQAEEIEASVEKFLRSLQEEELIVARPMADTPGSEPCKASIQTGGNPEKLPFVPPVLDTYTDMEELLLLDPIHEVDEGGWPKPKQ